MVSEQSSDDCDKGGKNRTDHPGNILRAVFDRNNDYDEHDASHQQTTKHPTNEL
jgi:hypothetical protein